MDVVESFLSAVRSTLATLTHGAIALLIPAAFFIALAILLKRGEAIAAGRRAAHEVRTNLGLYFIDIVLVVPALGVLTVAVASVMRALHLIVVPAEFWLMVGAPLTLLAAVFVGDFVGYWRHRLEHTRWLWPSHAINRVTTTIIDSSALLALGIPAWAAVANGLVRHYYGYFIHADLPWTYGALSRVFVSPAMHRWHHARELRYAGTNFATVFSIFDQAFGTFRLPGPCDVPLGLEDDTGRGVAGQLAYPFKRWFGPLFSRKPAKAADQP
jgi:sterol desaturase/sphingolipid hydroxylase (fatty acid hydroxylase superfamily)